MDTSVNGAYRSPSFASLRHVTYSCGSCGYDLSLSSSNRNTAKIGSKYDKSIKRGIISFFQIDESRKKTKLLCRKCGCHVGDAYDNRAQSCTLEAEGSDYSATHVNKESVGCRKYDIRIRALQPSSSAVQLGVGTPLYNNLS